MNLKQKLLAERQARLARFQQAAEKVNMEEREKERRERQARAKEEAALRKEEREREFKEQWAKMEHMFQNYKEVSTGAISYSGIVKQIIQEYTEETGYTLADLKSARRQQPLVDARQELYWQIYKNTNWSLPRIGKLFNKDHTTVLHGVRKVERRKQGYEPQSGAGVGAKDRRGKGMHVWRSIEDAQRHG
jgi:hypothetical protein